MKHLFLLLVIVSLPLRLDAIDDAARSSLTKIISQLQRADYEGDQAGMQKCFDDLAPFVKEDALASRVRYWRGFAMWRKAINGFNDSVDPKE